MTRIARPILTLDAARERRRAERSRLFVSVCAIACILGAIVATGHVAYDRGVADTIRAMRGVR